MPSADVTTGPVAASRPPKKRRSAEHTRRLLIAIAKDLVLARGVSSGVAHIRLQEVLRTAGLTTGAAYRIWPDQDAFQQELAAAVIDWRLDASTASTREMVCANGWPESIDDVIRLGAERHTATFASERRDDPESRIFMFALALRATAHGSPELRAASRARHAHSVAEFTEFYTEAMSRYGLRLRGRYTMTHFTTAMAALGEGFALHALEGLEHPVVTRSVEGRDDEQWTLFGVAIAGLAREFFVPCEEGPPCRAEEDAESPAAPGIPSDGPADQEKTVFTRTTP